MAIVPIIAVIFSIAIMLIVFIDFLALNLLVKACLIGLNVFALAFFYQHWKRENKEKRVLQLIENTPCGVLQIESNGSISFANRYFIELLGITEGDIVGKYLWDIANAEKAKVELKELLQITLQQSKNSSYNIQTQNREGNLLDLQIDWKMNRNSKGEITGAIGAVWDITAKKEAEKNIKHLCFYDSLTGVYNRSFFEVELQRLDVERQLPISVICGDVNSLKLVNDAFGHFEGDDMLIKISQALKSACRKEDVIARWGGDEFFILLPKTGAPEAEKVCNRIKETCASFSNEFIPLSISLGLGIKENIETDIEEVILKAENIMYSQKLLENSRLSKTILKSLESRLRKINYPGLVNIEKIQEMCLQFGKKLKLQEVELERLSLLARFHNIGYIRISQQTINKNKPLSPDEWEEIKKHSQTGYHIARSSNELLSIAEEILTHHEQWDGKGYPRRIKGEEIPVLSRILAIVDTYVAMTNSRNYRKRFTYEEAIAEIKKNAGIHFDPGLVDIFVNNFSEKKII